MSITQRTHVDVLFAALSATLLLGGCGAEAPSAPVEGGPPQPPAVVHVDPTSSTLQAGAAEQFTGIGLSNGGDTMDVALAWSATGGSIAPDGLYTAGDADGTFHVVAEHASGLADSARVTIEAPAEDTTSGEEPEPVASVTVSPNSLELQVDDTASLEATVEDADGDPLERTVAWSSSDDSVASVDEHGTVRARSAGEAAITAASGGESDTATVTVTAPEEPSAPEASLVAVRVEPDTATLETGVERQFSAAGITSGGDTTGVEVAWSATGGTITADGLYTAGETEGAFRVVAAHDSGLADTADVTVEAPPPPESAAECDDPDEAWIWCDDFEVDRLSSYFEYASGGGAFTREAGVGRDGSTGMRTRFEAGDVSAGALHLAFGRTPDPYFDPVDAGTSDYREIYWRIYVRNEPGWIGGGGDKLSRATVFATSGWAQAMIAHVWSGGSDPDWNYLVIDPASGTDEEGVLQTTKYNDFGNLRWLGLDRGDVPLFAGSHVGEWYCVEAHVRLNDPGSANGVFELWIDGKKDAERTGLNWVGSYDEYGVNAVFVENYWNDGSPQTQERYFDDFVVSTERIGC